MWTNYPYSRAHAFAHTRARTNVLLVLKLKNFVRLQVLMAVTVNNAISWGMKFIDVSIENGPGSSVGIARLATAWTVRGSHPVGARFSARPDRLWGPPSLLYNGTGSFPRVKSGRA